MPILINETLRAEVNPNSVAPACDGRLIALVENPCTVSVWQVGDRDGGPLRLQGHRKPITAVCLGSLPNPKLVCSAARDFVIIWNVEKVRYMTQKGEPSRGEVIATALGDVSVCVFDNKDSLVAAAVDSDVYLLSSTAPKVVAALQGRRGRIFAASFCPHYSATLVTTSEDRSFQVWDVSSFHLIYESTIIASTALISIAMSPAKPHVLLGTTDGMLKIYDLTDGNNFRSLSQVDVPKLCKKFTEMQESSKETENTGPSGPVIVRGKRSTWQTPEYFDGSCEEPSTVVTDEAILNMAFLRTAQDDAGDGNTSSAMEDVLLKPLPHLLVCTTQYLAQINSQSLQIVDLVPLSQPVPVDGCSTPQPLLTTGLHYACLGIPRRSLWPGSQASVTLVVGTQFHNTVHFGQWTLQPPEEKQTASLENSLAALPLGDGDSTTEDGQDGCELSIVATQPLCQKSPLKAEFIPKVKDSSAGSSGARGQGPGRKKKVDPLHQPLTFKTSVKSSGYTAAPRTTMFQPKTNKPLRAKEKGFNPDATFTSAGAPVVMREYQAGKGPPCQLMEAVAVVPRPTAVTTVRYAGSGTALACSLVDGTAQVWRLSGGKTQASSSLLGHDAAVNSVTWSHSGQWLLTASQDCSAVVWARDGGKPVLKITSLTDNLNSAPDGKPGQVTGESLREVKQAQFFYMDRFLLLVSGGSLCLYKYHLDLERDEIRRYLTRSRYKLVSRWTTASQVLTTMTAVNAFYSHLALTAGSNRSLSVFDLNEGRLVHEFPDAHPRPAHALVLNEGSGYALQSPLAQNVFLSAAASDCIKLWDLRSRQCVQRYEGHLNKVHSCELAVSPCGQYVASGSEDRQVYVFDTRTGTYCERLKGHSDVVSTVSFNPSKPQLASASINGKLLMFGLK